MPTEVHFGKERQRRLVCPPKYGKEEQLETCVVEHVAHEGDVIIGGRNGSQSVPLLNEQLDTVSVPATDQVVAGGAQNAGIIKADGEALRILGSTTRHDLRPLMTAIDFGEEGSRDDVSVDEVLLGIAESTDHDA